MHAVAPLVACAVCAAAAGLLALHYRGRSVEAWDYGAPFAEARRAPFDVARGHVIALDAAVGRGVALEASRWLGIADVRPFEAVDGGRAADIGGAVAALPLYTRLLMRSGRHDHLQLSNMAMLGCLLSHMAVWRGVGPNETVAVFEEDALFDGASWERFGALAADLRGLPWDLLMLEEGHIIATGAWRRVGGLAATCAAAAHANGTCSWFGTRGYLVTHRGAQRLLAHAEPISVQVDALMSLVAAFDPDFRMYWTTASVAHQNPFHVTGVWDGCIKCYLPNAPLFYGLALVGWGASLGAAAWCAWCLRCGLGQFKLGPRH